MRVGDVIDGKYRVIRELGAGGIGAVFVVEHVKLGTELALKILLPEAMAIAGITQRFLREAQAASRLKNDHVCGVTDYGELPNGAPYMVMELLEGMDLSKALTQGPLHPSVAVDYILQACEALAEAHRNGTFHRDIKPANLFITTDADGRPFIKVLDFGIATSTQEHVNGRLTKTQTVMGSPCYMSPEQHRSARDVDGRSDIWALGVSLYECVAGRIPFDSEMYGALVIKVAMEPHPPLVGIDPRLSTVIDRALAKDPNHRYANIVELAQALAPFTPDGAKAAARVARVFGAAPPIARHSDPTVVRSPGYTATPNTTLGGSAGQSATNPGSVGSEKRVWIPLVAGAVLVSVAIVGIAAATKRGSRSDTPVAPAGAAQPEANVQPAPVPPPAAAQTPAVAQPAPVPAPAAPAPAPILVDAGVEATTLVSIDARLPAAKVTPQKSKQASTKTTTTATKPPKVSCDPPYTVDPNGKRIYKSECL